MTTTLNGNICPRRKGWTIAAHAQQFQLLFHDRLFQCLGNLHFRQIRAVDFLVPALACTGHSIVVIFSRKQVQIPHLRLTRHEHLNSPRHQKLGIVLAQGTVIGGVDLIVYIFLAVQVLHHAAPRNNQVDQTLDAFLRQQAL